MRPRNTASRALDSPFTEVSGLHSNSGWSMLKVTVALLLSAAVVSMLAITLRVSEDGPHGERLVQPNVILEYAGKPTAESSRQMADASRQRRDATSAYASSPRRRRLTTAPASLAKAAAAEKDVRGASGATAATKGGKNDDFMERLRRKMDHWQESQTDAPTPEFQNLPGCPVGDRTGVFNESRSLNDLFKRLMTDPAVSRYSPTLLSADPWIVQFDSYLSTDEAEALVNDCQAWKPDIVVGGLKDNAYRNSSSFNCRNTVSACEGLSGIGQHRQRIQSLLGVPWTHTEGLNVLKYQEGGFYRRHHDYIMPDQKPRCHINAGPRILTFMVYLSDVEAGGGTDFFHLNLTVKPRAGRAVLWADVKSDSPLEKDERTAHEALRVNKGTKVVATTWFRQYDAAQNLYNGCCMG